MSLTRGNLLQPQCQITRHALQQMMIGQDFGLIGDPVADQLHADKVTHGLLLGQGLFHCLLGTQPN